LRRWEYKIRKNTPFKFKIKISLKKKSLKNKAAKYESSHLKIQETTLISPLKFIELYNLKSMHINFNGEISDVNSHVLTLYSNPNQITFIIMLIL